MRRYAVESLEDLFNDDSFLSNFIEPPQLDISSVDFVTSSSDGDYAVDIKPAANLEDEHEFPIQPDGDYTYQQIVLPEPLPLVSLSTSVVANMKLKITGDLIPGSAGHTLLSSLSNNLFDV